MPPGRQPSHRGSTPDLAQARQAAIVDSSDDVPKPVDPLDVVRTVARLAGRA